jgi:hypothetical protein
MSSVVLLATLPARAAIELEPGLWQDTATTVTDGKSGAPDVNNSCLSPEEARDPIKTIMKDTEGQQCDTRNVRQNGNTVTVEMKCTDPGQKVSMAIDMTINVVDPRHYNGTIKSLVVFKGQKIATEAAIDAKWMSAACKK